MADAKTHEGQAKHNYAFLTHFQKGGAFRDWQITVAFYTALHIIDCGLEKASPGWRGRYVSAALESGWHAQRNKAVGAVFSDIYSNYRMLQEKSKAMRYLEADAANKKAIDAISTKDAKELVDKNLGAILKKFNYSW